MVLGRIAAAAALALLALPAGCKQSLFDDHTGGADGAIGPVVDADPNQPDGPPGPDAPPGSMCPSPCTGDAVANFAMTQGGTNMRWRYLEDLRAPHGANYADLAWDGTTNRWHPADGSPPAIATCAGSSEGECAGITNTILMVPSTDAAMDTDPALAFVAPANGTYRITGDLRAPDGTTSSVMERLFISRNSRHDLVLKKAFTPTTAADAFMVDVDALAGDQILVSLTPAAPGATAPLGLHVFASDQNAFPGACQLALTFDGADPFLDPCTGATHVNVGTTAGPSVNGRLGGARVFAEAQEIRSAGPALDYSGDWTIQFWASSPGFWTTSVYFADWDCNAQGGVHIDFDDAGIFVGMFYKDPATEWCYTSPPPPNYRDPPTMSVSMNVSDNVWRFYRLSRSTADGLVRLCVDGSLKGQVTVPGAADMSSGTPPHIGRNVDYNPPYFVGSIDDVRVYKRALPCPTVP